MSYLGGIMRGMDENESILIRDEKGRFAKGTRPASIIKNSEQSLALHRKRQEKAARLLRARIAEETGKVSTLPIRDGAEAVAEAGALIWSETVLGADAYPRDRLEAWERIGKYAGILQPPGQQQAQAGGVTVTVDADTARDMLAQLLAARQAQAGMDGGGGEG